MRKRVLYSILIILAWFGFVVEGSHALFVDAATLSGSSVTTGTVDLQISNSQNGSSTLYADSRPGFSMILNPGEFQDNYLFLKNASASPISMDVDVLAAMQTTSVELQKSLALEFVPVDSAGVATADPIQMSMTQLTTARQSLKVSLDKGGTQRFRVRTSLISSFASQGQAVTYDLVFNGVQHYVQ
jgi:hypothetical protein